MTDPMPATAVDVVVIGAGQAGLAVAAHLVRSGFVPVVDPDRPPTGAPTFVVLDAANGPGGAWRERWPGLTMRTVNGVYELPGAPLPAFGPEEPAADALPRYFGAYERDLGLAVRRPVQVRQVRDLGGPERLLAVETRERVAPATDPVIGSTAPAAIADPTVPDRPSPVPAVVDGRDLGDGAGPCRAIPGPVPGPDLAGAGAAPISPVPISPAPIGPAPTDPTRTGAAPTAPTPAPNPARRRGERTWLTRALVNATGTWTRPFWPVYPGTDVFAGEQVHTHDFRLPEDYAGRRVIVVGGGISAVQHLLAIHPYAAATTWVTRRPPDWRDQEFSPEAGRAAVARVEERTRAGLPPQSIVAATGLPLTDSYRQGIADGILLARPMFAALVPDGAIWTPQTAHGPLADGWQTGPEHVPADVVLWATGFRAALDHLRPLGLRDRGGGIRVDGTQAVVDPRVQLVGYGPSASTVGANRAGRAAVRQVRRLLGV